MYKGIIFTEGRGELNPIESSTEQAFAGIADDETGQMLRNAFTYLFEQEIPHLKTLFLFQMSGGWKAALKAFAKSLNEKSAHQNHLLIDFQDIPENSGSKQDALVKQVEEYFEKGEIDASTVDFFMSSIQDVYFMVQKMEAWILSQPDVIEQCFGHLKFNRTKFETKKGKELAIPVSSIKDPDAVLNELLRYFEKPDKNETLRKLKYEKGGKVRLAYEMLTKLDMKRLMADFEDVRSLVEKIRQVNGS
ncbi:MAG: DUF4276 family protein [Saprospiraceae bacterium]|nr:DUF4276 family protein [Saprospiraceae bacterium]